MADLNPPRRRGPRAVGAAAALSLLLVGCAHGGPSSGPAGLDDAMLAEAEQDLEDAPEPTVRPQSQLEARALLQQAFEASALGHTRQAVNLISAVLATDFLTDQGRVNLYWLVAEGHLRAGDTRAHFESLGMFLLASELLPGPTGDEVNTRRLLARSVLAARRVAVDPDFGRRMEKAIDVEDVREPGRIFGALPCGPDGDGRFVDVQTEAVHDGGSLYVQRTARCDQEQAQLQLWFDVTHARGVED